MSKKSEVIAARCTALGLRVLSNDAVESSTPSAKAIGTSIAIDTSIAYANHCNDGKRLTAADIESQSKTAPVHAPLTALERANGRLSLVPMDEHSLAS